MADLSAATYLGYAESRLREAGERCEKALLLGYAQNLGELAKVASLIWDGAMDMMSALTILDGNTPTGSTSSLRRYARQILTQDEYNLWRGLARLHNFQHKPNHSETVFRTSCHVVASLLNLLNKRLPDSMQLSLTLLEWLAAV